MRCRWLWFLAGADDDDEEENVGAAISSGRYDNEGAVDRAREAEAEGLNCTTAPNLAALAATDAPWVLMAAAEWCGP